MSCGRRSGHKGKKAEDAVLVRAARRFLEEQKELAAASKPVTVMVAPWAAPSATVGEAKVCLLGQDLLVPLPLDPWGDLEQYWAQAAEAARVIEANLEVAEVALQADRVRYRMLTGMLDVLCCNQNDCSTFLEWQMAWGVPVDLGELKDVELPLDNNDLPLA